MDTGSNIPTVNATNLRKQLLSLPPIGEQKRIVAKIEQALSVLDTIDELQAQYADNLTVLKGKLIDAAIQGKLTKQLPEDGTAEELYHLIRDEKQELIKAGKIKRETPLPEITSEEVPFAIPKNWKWVRWGELSNQIQYGYNAPAKDSGRIKMVRITDIQGNRVNWQNVPYCDIDEYEIGEYKLYPRDILFARTGGTVGKSYLVESVEEDSVFAGYLIRTNYSLRLNAKYMKYFMDSRLYWKQLQDGTTATAQPNCNAKTLSKMMLPLPPKDEQERIVSVLDKALQVIDT
nr:restriction endonuclease subunit S [Clostridia bacterium]